MIRALFARCWRYSAWPWFQLMEHVPIRVRSKSIGEWPDPCEAEGWRSGAWGDDFWKYPLAYWLNVLSG